MVTTWTASRSTMALVCLLTATACGGDTLVLEGEGVVVEYPCGADAGGLPRSSAEQDLVRRHAARIVQHANDAGEMERVVSLIEAYDGGDFATVEGLVVARLCEHRDEVMRQPRFPEPGSSAPSLRAHAVAGTSSIDVDTVVVPDPRGRYVLVDFWASWCAPCVAKYPAMVRLANEFPKDRIAVVGVIRQESAESALAWLEENGGVHYPWISDPGSTIARSYGVRGIPHMFLLDPEGRVVRSCTGCQLGSMNPEALRDLLREIL